MPNYATTLQYPCVHCDDGSWEQDVDSNGNPIGAPENGGGCDCPATGHEAALQAAWEEFCDQDGSDAMERRYRDGGSGDSDSLHRLEQARRVR
jgi:hypothetical protein